MERRKRLPDGTFGPSENIGSSETEKEKVARLELEKEILISTIMEMSVYMADQETRILGQESAIMELSMLMAMNMTGGSE